MELYIHPISTTSRAVLLFVEQNDIAVERRVVDLLSGEHLRAPFLAINPNGIVPVLVDGSFHLTESSAILKYLADLIGSPAYPKDLRRRAKVNEAMDWINTNFYRSLGYDLVYPQIFLHHHRRSEEAQAATLDWGCEKSRGWLGILDRHLLGPEQSYLCGGEMTIADYLGAPFVTLGEAVGCNFSSYPNIIRWLDNMRRLDSWPKVFKVFDGFVETLREQKLVAV